jgi:hypothetical protein
MPPRTCLKRADASHTCRAGLRTLSATMTNVVDVCINYLRRKVHTGYNRALIRTIRGVGYQIGGTAARSAVAGSPVGVGSSRS